MIRSLSTLTLLILIMTSCSKEDFTLETYDCDDNMDYSVHPKSAEFESFIDDIYEKGLPGISILILDENQGGWVYARGKVDIVNDIDFEPCNYSRVGSVTKLYTSVVVMKLYELEMLNLNDKIANYLNSETIEKITNGKTITIRQLLNHSSGIINYTSTISYGLDFLNTPTQKAEIDDLLNYVKGKESYFTPGASHEYSNTNFVLLQMIIENITNKSLQENYKEIIFNPLDLNQTFFNPENPSPNGSAKGYTDLYENETIVETTQFTGIGFGDGGISTNIFDLHRTMKALFNGELLQNTTVELMQEWIDVPEPKIDLRKYGLGLRYWDTQYGYAIGVTGGLWGYSAETFYFPERQTYISIIVNGSHGKIDEIVDYQLHNKLPRMLFE